MTNIALFASGSGTNVENITKYFSENKEINVVHLFCNKQNAFVLERAKNLQLPYTVFNRDEFYNSNDIINKLNTLDVDYIVLAGFLWLIPQNLIHEFPNKIINVHPALLPNYGGKGMYGMNVHNAVIKNNEKESGITVHFVNEKYDDGNIIAQKKCSIDINDNPNDLAEKIHKLEQNFFPSIIEDLINNNI